MQPSHTADSRRLSKAAAAILHAIAQSRHALTLDSLQTLLRQQQASVLGFELRTLCAALEEEGHIRRDPTSLAPGKSVAYLPGPRIGQPLDLHSLRLELRVQQRALPLQTPDKPRVPHGRAPSVFALGQEIAAESPEAQ
ncbi:MAG: hypothetical protein ACP5RV_12305 [Thiomonas sp.]